MVPILEEILTQIIRLKRFRVKEPYVIILPHETYYYIVTDRDSWELVYIANNEPSIMGIPVVRRKVKAPYVMSQEDFDEMEGTKNARFRSKYGNASWRLF